MLGLMDLIRLEARQKVFTSEKVEIELPLSGGILKIPTLWVLMGNENEVERRIKEMIPTADFEELNEQLKSFSKNTEEAFTKLIDKKLTEAANALGSHIKEEKVKDGE